MNSEEKENIDSDINRFFAQPVIYQPQIDSFKKHQIASLSKNGVAYFQEQLRLFLSRRGSPKNLKRGSQKRGKNKKKPGANNTSIRPIKEVLKAPGLLPGEPNTQFNFSTQYDKTSWGEFLKNNKIDLRHVVSHLNGKIKGFNLTNVIIESEMKLVSDFIESKIKQERKRNEVTAARAVSTGKKIIQRDNRFKKVNPKYKGVGKIIYIASRN